MDIGSIIAVSSPLLAVAQGWFAWRVSQQLAEYGEGLAA